MEASGYISLTRQSGLLKELQTVANNIANQGTSGYRQEGLIFVEHVARRDGAPSLSMAKSAAYATSFQQGELTTTGGAFDLAIEGTGFFLVETPGGVRLTRNGAFSPDAQGMLVNSDGHPVLDAGQAPILLPGTPNEVAIAADGTISHDGRPLGQIGVFEPADPALLRRETGVLFSTDAELQPSQNTKLRQGALEGSNVDPMGQIARLIEVQRAYELGQTFLEQEHERARSVTKTLMG